MTSVLTETCPACQAAIRDDDITCGHCGAEVPRTPSGSLSPLILPGNPALSADMFRGPKSRLPSVAAVVAGVAAIVAVVFLRPNEEQDAQSAPPPIQAEAAPVSGETMPSVPLASTATATPEVNSAIASAASIESAVPAPAVLPAAMPPASAPPAAAPLAMQPAVRSAVAVDASPATVVPKVIPVFSIAPLVSDSMRQGELLQLRWNVVDRTTRRPLSARVEFTSSNESVASVDRRTGVVRAISPGRAQIISDAGAAGEKTVTLTVRAPSRPLTASTPATNTRAATPPAANSQAANTAAASTPAANSVPANNLSASTRPANSVINPAPRLEMLTDSDLRVAVDRFIADVQSTGARNAELIEFIADGDGHRIALQSGPAVVSSSTYSNRVMFEISLRKYDSGGRPLTRISTISMDVEKRDGVISASAIAISALRRP